MRFLLFVFILAVTPLWAAQYLRCGRLLDATAGRLQPDVALLIETGKITKIGPAAEVPAPAGAQVTELPHATCLPGLIDVHVHLTSDPKNSGYQHLGISVPRATVTAVKSARATLYAGFTTIRNLGAPGFSDVAVRDGIAAGDIVGPRMLVSGPPLSITGGHCDENLLAPEFHYSDEGVADGPWAVRAKVRQVIKYGADVIKVCASGGVLSKGDQPGTPQYSYEELRAIAEEAHKLGRKATAHAHGAQSIKDAIRAGFDSIEHASFIDDEGIRLAKEHRTFLVFDLYNDSYILQQGPTIGMLAEFLEKERLVGANQRENFRRAVQAGVRMAFGTDAGVYPHGENARQFAVMTKNGMPAIEAIRAATSDAAELLGWSDRAGALKTGCFADVIAVEGSPLEDVSLLERVRFIMQGGYIFRNEWSQ
jgi:imidazolonepropionase-like amidohydrolase